MSINSKRRDFLKVGASGLGVFMLSGGMTKALADACGLTPAQTSGPFYPGEDKFHQENDLTQIAGKAQATGQIIYLSGRILNANCKPVPGVHVEIWQACATGKYNNPNDPNPAAIDPNFKYWGETTTSHDGTYRFKSIIPGAYPADTDWMRPPHIHFKVSALGYHELITQMYFKGNQYNDADLILKDVPANERESVIVDFVPTPFAQEPNALSGVFDITIQSVR